LIQEQTSFKLVFSHLFHGISTDNFKNVTIVVENDERFPIIVNSVFASTTGIIAFDIILIAK